MIPDDLLAFVRAALPAPPARVLEVGAGDGELAEALRALGHDVLAIDPVSEADAVARTALLDVDEPDGSFDAALAVRSLHHVEPLRESCERLAALVRPGGRLVVDEFDVERLDERAARWMLGQRAAVGDDSHSAADELVAAMRAHLHPVSLVVEALAPAFTLGDPVPCAYLYRWNVPPGLRGAEERLIAAGDLPATGARLVGSRRS